MIICSGRWTTEEVSSSGLDSVTRCLWGRTGSWSQVCLIHTPVCLSVCLIHTPVCLSDPHTRLSALSGLAVSQLVLSYRTVWVRCLNGDLARRYGISDRNAAGDYWKKIPGTANWLTGKSSSRLRRHCLGCVAVVSCVSVFLFSDARG